MNWMENAQNEFDPTSKARQFQLLSEIDGNSPLATEANKGKLKVVAKQLGRDAQISPTQKLFEKHEGIFKLFGITQENLGECSADALRPHALYPRKLKTWELDKEAPRFFCPARGTVFENTARVQDEKSVGKRALSKPKFSVSLGIAADCGIRFLSQAYDNYWESYQRDQNVDVPFPDAHINFIQHQIEAYNEIKKLPKAQSFPLKELWRFAIDKGRQHLGCCAYESEPGYLKSFFAGMTYALKSATAQKTANWYESLHTVAVKDVKKSQRVMDGADGTYNAWRLTPSEEFIAISPGYRTDAQVSLNLSQSDQDEIGKADIAKTRLPNSDITGSQVILHAQEKSTTKNHATKLFSTYNALLNSAKSSADRLVVHLWAARELYITHLFDDGNTRTAHLAFISMIAGDTDLPLCLLHNPKMFAANGPESCAFRYLEGCVNFKNDGKCSPAYHARSVGYSSRTKQLATLEIDAKHQDLIDLKAALAPLVEGKTWDEALQGIHPQAKELLAEYFSD